LRVYISTYRIEFEGSHYQKYVRLKDLVRFLDVIKIESNLVLLVNAFNIGMGRETRV